MSFNFDMNDPFMSFASSAPPDGCTQCGMCLSSCPTFISTEDAQQSPMGRIRLIRSLEKEGCEGLAEEQMAKLESCLSCYSCEAVCPSKVSFGKMLDESLARLREVRPVPRLTRVMLYLADKKAFLKPLLQLSVVAQLVGIRSLLSELGLLRLMGLQRASELLGKIKFPFRLHNCVERPNQDERVALFSGCFSSALEQDIQQASIDVLNALGIEVSIPKAQGCCGALHHHNGELDTAARLARNNIRAFAGEKAEAIISCSSGCGAGLKAYASWLEGEELSMPVMDVSHYLAGLLSQREVEFRPLNMKVALHIPCTLRQLEGQEEAVLALLQNIPGLEIIPLPGEPRCCGAGGSQMLTQAEMADDLAGRVVEQIRSSEADVLLSSNLGCAMHLRRSLAQAGMAMELLHPVELLARAVAVD